MRELTLRLEIALYILAFPLTSGLPFGHSSAVGGDEPTSVQLIGKPAPAFAVTTLDGKPVALADYRGRAVLINFWATWCGNCKVEMPWLARLREQYAGQEFEVLSISTGTPLT